MLQELDHFAESERHIAEFKQRIAEQKERIEPLRRDGPTSLAKEASVRLLLHRCRPTTFRFSSAGQGNPKWQRRVGWRTIVKHPTSAA